jgi:hypothetical protein
MAKKLRIKQQHRPAITITRTALHASQLVYIASASKIVRYPWGKSRITYIGTTKNGVHRIASSAAWKAKYLLTIHGIKQLEFFVVTCNAQQAVQTWRKLERALLIRFRQRFGEVPKGNAQGKNMQWKGEEKYFAISKLDRIIDLHS